MSGLVLARIGGIEIRVPLGWVMVIAVIAALVDNQVGASGAGVPEPVGWVIGGAVGLGYFVGATMHDLAHAVVARRRGIGVTEIVVSFFGGVSSLDPVGRTADDELAIALAGPLTSLALGLLLGLLGFLASLGGGFLAGAVAPGLVSLALLLLFAGLVNLVPAYPLDGGRVVRAIAWRRRGSAAAGLAAAARAGRVVGFSAIIVGIPIAAVGDLTNGLVVSLSGWLLILTSRTIADRTALAGALGAVTVGEVLDADLPVANASLAVDTFSAQFLQDGAPPAAFPVMRDGRLLGIVGPAQLRRVRPASWPQLRVEAIMVPLARLRVAAPGDLVIPAFERMRRSGLDGLPVLGPGGYLGMLTLRGIRRRARAHAGLADAPEGEPGQAAAGSPPDESPDDPPAVHP